MITLLTALHALAQGQAKELPKSPASDSYWLPLDASATTASVDWLYYVLYWVSVLVAVGIFGAMIHFVLKYRATSRSKNVVPAATADHNTTLEITWSVLPLFALIAFFVWGFRGYVDLRSPPKGAMEIHATGQKWQWMFSYPDGTKHPELHVPVDQPVRVIIESVDVLHSLYIPAFRTKMDAVPGRYTDLWFNANRTGRFPIFCAEYCGTSHSDMLSTVEVHQPGGYEAWLQKIKDLQDDLPPVELGKSLYTERGCVACHSTDGSPKVGPTWKGVFGSTHALADGSTVTVDENYIRESILEPQAKITQGFAPSMPTFKGQLDDKQINGLVEYIKSLK